jgi:hypothetical protein
MPLAEMQAKWVAQLITGQCRLPDRAKMQQQIDHESKIIAQRYTDSPRHTFEVDFYPYKASLQQEMKKMKV